MSVGAILAFLIANGPTLITAGSSVASIVSAFFEDFGGKGKDDPVTEAEFNAFVDRCLGDRAKIEALIAAARAEMGA